MFLSKTKSNQVASLAQLLMTMIVTMILGLFLLRDVVLCQVNYSLD